MTSTLPPSLQRLVPLFHELDDPALPCHRERLRIRVAAGWSQLLLARHLGVAQRNISNWERPGMPEPTPIHRALYRLALKELERRALKRALDEAFEYEAETKAAA